MTPRNGVLIPCGGRWVGAVLATRAAMAEVPELAGGRLVVADREPVTPAGCFADAAVVVPPVADPSYVDALLAACAEHAVRVVLPLIDIDLERLAPHKARFAAAGTTVVCPDEEVVGLCLDKARFDAFCRARGLAVPRLVAPDALLDATYPLFKKRVRGFGSIGAGIVQDAREARAALAEGHPLLFQEVIRAEEVSVDVVINGEGRAVVRVPRQRDKVVGGEAQRSHTLPRSAVRDLADATVRALAEAGLRGPANVQIFASDPPLLIEVNTRIGSCTVLSNAATGGRLYRSILFEAVGRRADGDPDDYVVDLHVHRFVGDVFFGGGTTPRAAPGGTR